MLDEQVRPEKMLVSAILERAYFDAIGQIGLTDIKGERLGWKLGRNDSIQTTAIGWIRSDSDHEFGYVWCCDQLGLPLDVIRGALNNALLNKKRKRRSYQGRWFNGRFAVYDDLYSCNIVSSWK